MSKETPGINREGRKMKLAKVGFTDRAVEGHSRRNRRSPIFPPQISC